MAIGKFECVHLGHQALIHRAKEAGAKLGLPTVVLTFSPHPRAVLGSGDFRPLLSEKEVEWALRELCGADYWLRYAFTETTARMPPQEFCDVLFGRMKARALFVGEGYRFGANRSGTVETLGRCAARHGAGVSVAPLEKIGGAKISASRIRGLVERGELDEAARLLGFPYPPRI